MRLNALGQVGGAEAFEGLLAGLRVGGVIIKGQHDEGQAELRVRKHPDQVRQAVQHRFNGHRDLLLDLLGRTARVEGDDIDLEVRHIGKGLDGQVVKGRPAAADEEDHHQHDEQRLMQRETDDPSNHGRLFEYLLEQGAAVGHHPLAELRSRQDNNTAILLRADLDLAPGELTGLLLDKHVVLVTL